MWAAVSCCHSSRFRAALRRFYTQDSTGSGSINDGSCLVTPLQMLSSMYMCLCKGRACQQREASKAAGVYGTAAASVALLLGPAISQHAHVSPSPVAAPGCTSRAKQAPVHSGTIVSLACVVVHHLRPARVPVGKYVSEQATVVTLTCFALPWPHAPCHPAPGSRLSAARSSPAPGDIAQLSSALRSIGLPRSSFDGACRAGLVASQHSVLFGWH